MVKALGKTLRSGEEDIIWQFILCSKYMVSTEKLILSRRQRTIRDPRAIVMKNIAVDSVFKMHEL